MHKPAHQAEFFTLLATLFNYMVSGKSHIGFLSNNLGNIYAQEPVQEIFDCIIVGKPWYKQLDDNSEGELDGESDLSDAEFEGTRMARMEIE
jgi:hypothetical protein